jgi:ABC-type long-subunit fatty acid transport system fused permease/ATPase subunit
MRMAHYPLLLPTGVKLNEVIPLLSLAAIKVQALCLPILNHITEQLCVAAMSYSLIGCRRVVIYAARRLQ